METVAGEILKHVDVSKTRATPKSSILIGFSIINHPFWGTIICGNTYVKKGSENDFGVEVASFQRYSNFSLMVKLHGAYHQEALRLQRSQSLSRTSTHL